VLLTYLYTKRILASTLTEQNNVTASYWRHCHVSDVTLTSLKRALTSFCYVSVCNLWRYDSGDIPTCRHSS